MKLKKNGLFLLGLITIIILATSGCAQKGGEAPPAPTPAPIPEPIPEPAADIGAGKQVFVGKGCGGCHTIRGLGGALGIVGPELSDIGARGDAASIKESIIDPSAIVVENFPPIMPEGFGDQLTEEELNNLVAYLESLKG